MRFSQALVTLALIVIASTVRSSAQAPIEGPFVAGELLVKFRPGAAADAQTEAHRAVGGAPVAEIQRTGVHRVRVPARSETAALARYQRNPNVLYAEPNFVRRIPTLAANGAGAAVPGDYHFAEQWALENTGQGFYCIPWLFGDDFCLYQGTPDADIDAPEAWSIQSGDPTVIVAVIDSGIDYTHPDLAANYAGGEDFVSLDGDPMDDHGHGTHVAGTIAAAMNNQTGTPATAEGVVGVAPNARILAYKVCGPDGTCDDFAIQQAIARAIADGARVINMSLGQSAYSQSLDDAVQDAWAAGLVIVAGAGNDGVTTPFYPAALDHVISVAAFDENHVRPSFSNYGNWVDISAPGTAVMSTYPMSACETSTTAGDIGCYTWNTGTSMATPHVTGAAALVWSRSDVTTNEEVVNILLSSADGKGVATGRLDSWTIHGGLNLRDAVAFGLTNLPPLADAGPDQTVADQDRDGAEPITLDAGASSDRDGVITTYEWREGGTLVASGATPVLSLTVGVHTLVLEVTDDGGERATDSVVITVTPANEVSVTASTPQATEAGPGAGRFTISRSGNTGAPLTVQYGVSGAAAAGDDYTTLPGAVTIEAGSATAIVVVTPVDDTKYEDAEPVVLTLSVNAAYGLGSPSAATITIISDDLPPDLIVTAMSAPATSGAGTDLVVTDTTKNQGTGGSPPSSTGFYLSVNTALDASDLWLGSRPLVPLAPGATDIRSTTLNMPSSIVTGSYYLLAKSDWDSAVAEGVETNNVRSSAAVKIGPDLVVTAVAAPASAVAGGTIDVSDTAKNQGGGGAAASTTRFYWSANTAFDASDQIIGSRAVSSLAAGASTSATTPVTVPSSTVAGVYYVIAQADGGGALLETTETNNTRASAAVKVGPDLIMTAVSVPSTGAAGAMVSVSDTTKNQGSGPAASSSTGFYLSANTIIDAGDTFIGNRSAGPLAAGGTSTASTPFEIPADTPPGSYYVIGRADWNGGVAEYTETNNDRASGLIRIGGDLVVPSLSAPATVMLTGPLVVTDSTKNQGFAPVPQSTTAFYLSLNTAHDGNDRLLGSRAVSALGPSQTESLSTSLAIPAGTSAGSYYVIAVADAGGAVAESLENNNTRASAVVRIGPDLTVTSLTAPSSAIAGAAISASDTTRNQGADVAPASVTTFYLSSNSSFDAGDLLLAARDVPPLGPGASAAGAVTLPLPASTPAGTYYIVARSDGTDLMGEAQEGNNTRVRTISIAAPTP